MPIQGRLQDLASRVYHIAHVVGHSGFTLQPAFTGKIDITQHVMQAASCGMSRDKPGRPSK